MRVVVVPVRNAEALRRELQACGAVDRGLQITKRAGHVLIPLRLAPDVGLDRFGAWIEDVRELPVRIRPRNPQDVLRERLKDAGVPEGLAPTRWERIGDVVAVRIPDAARPHAKTVARVLGEVLGARTVVEDVSGIHGPFRVPRVCVLWGNGTETTHTEGGIRFRLDAARVMFSSGNVAERTSTGDRIGPSDVVVDLFAGIGYFSIPIAVRGRGRTVHACELNPVAHAYLLENLRLNRVDNVVPHLGDCRDTAPRGVADWVLLGHFEALRYLDVAVRALRDEGVLVVHGLCGREAYPDGAVQRVANAVRELGAEFLGATPRLIKSYAPGILHVVVEAEVRRPPKGLSGPAASEGR